MTLRAHHDPVPVDGADWLAPHRDTFLAELRGDGFAPGTIQHYRYVIDVVCSAIDSRGLGAMTVNEPVAGRYSNHGNTRYDGKATTDLECSLCPVH